MSDDDAPAEFDPDSLPRAAAADPSLPGSLELGAFSISLSVADLAASEAFYSKLGFVTTGGDADGGWLILKNGETTIGLFHGMFEKNMLTFNPGLTNRMERLDDYTDVREIAERLAADGVEIDSAIEPNSEGPGSITVIDPDGNPVLIDQFF